MWKELCRASIPLLSSLRMPIEVGILALVSSTSMVLLGVLRLAIDLRKGTFHVLIESVVFG